MGGCCAERRRENGFQTQKVGQDTQELIGGGSPMGGGRCGSGRDAITSRLLVGLCTRLTNHMSQPSQPLLCRHCVGAGASLHEEEANGVLLVRCGVV